MTSNYNFDKTLFSLDYCIFRSLVLRKWHIQHVKCELLIVVCLLFQTGDEHISPVQLNPSPLNPLRHTQS